MALAALLACAATTPRVAQAELLGDTLETADVPEPDSGRQTDAPQLVDIDAWAATPTSQAAPGPQATAEGVHQRVAELDKELEDLQSGTRLYLAGWLTANVALSGAQFAVAMTSERRETRGNYFVGAGLAVAGIGVLLAQPWPGWSAHKKYRAIRTNSVEEEVRKIARGEESIKRQRHWDHIAVHGDKHIAAGVIAVGAGLGVGLGFNSIKEGLSRAIGVLFILELQILTRPGTYFTPKSEPGKNDRPYLAFAPLIDRYTQGIALNAVF